MLVGRLGIVSSSTPTRGGPPNACSTELLASAAGEPILASATTKPFLERRFDVEPLMRRTRLPSGVACHRARDADRRATPFVSRAREIGLLEDLLTQVEEGRGQAVLLAGDPGIGKTRLLHEFHRRTGDRAAWLQGQPCRLAARCRFIR